MNLGRVKARIIDDRKQLRIELIRSYLRSLRSIDSTQLSRWPKFTFFNRAQYKVEAVAHLADGVYHAFHPVCFQFFTDANPKAKCPHCFVPLSTIDGAPYAVKEPVNQSPEDALLEAAGMGDALEVQSLLNTQHKFPHHVLDQAVKVASCHGHNGVVEAILAVHKLSSHARSQSIEMADENFNAKLKSILQADNVYRS